MHALKRRDTFRTLDAPLYLFDLERMALRLLGLVRNALLCIVDINSLLDYATLHHLPCKLEAKECILMHVTSASQLVVDLSLF